MSLKKLLQFLNRADLTLEQIDLGFETRGQDIGVELASRLLKARPTDGFKSKSEILAVSGIGPKRMNIMLEAASSGRLEKNNTTSSENNHHDDLVHPILENPNFIPSFRARVPLGLNDYMAALVSNGVEVIPVLESLLSNETSAQVRKAAVVMLAYIDSPVAESLIVNALNNPDTRAEALVVLANFHMRDPDGRRAFESNFLYDPDTALNKILPLIEIHETVVLDSGFTVYEGPLSHLALGAAARIYGVDNFIHVLRADLLVNVGIQIQPLVGIVFEVLFDFFRQALEAARSALGITDNGIITPTIKNDEFTLTFTCDGECNCKKIGWIQVCKATLPSGSVGYAAGEKGRDTDKDGRLIDRLDGRKNPVYGSGNDAAGTIPKSSGQYGKSGKPPTSAKLTDRPSGPPGTVFEFESCVFCLEGKDAGTCYGCYMWTCTIQKDGKPKYEVKGSADKPSADYKKAAKEWNGVAGKIDTPDPDKW
jgi:hypothetical protein